MEYVIPMFFIAFVFITAIDMFFTLRGDKNNERL